MRKYWFTSDYHFSHYNIIRYCNRPFSSIEDMNGTLLENINSKVNEEDILYVLGDFAFSRPRHLWYDVYKKLRNIIRCKNVILVTGNHDPYYFDYQTMTSVPHPKLNDIFQKVVTTCFVKIPQQTRSSHTLSRIAYYEFYLSHYACRVWNKSHYGAIHLYGHSHGTLKDIGAPDKDHHGTINERSLDVGVDCNNYFPFSLKDVMDRIFDKHKVRGDII